MDPKKALLRGRSEPSPDGSNDDGQTTTRPIVEMHENACELRPNPACDGGVIEREARRVAKLVAEELSQTRRLPVD